MSSVASELLNWLSREKQIHVKQDWLQACLQFVADTEASTESLKEKVYEQWLNCDLDVVFDGTRCTHAMRSLHEHLHSSLTEQQLPMHVEGTIIVQLQHFHDCNRSKYSQIVNLDLDEKTDKATNKRMLSLTLTDGIEWFKAAEFDAIKQLDETNLKLGCKLKLSGTIKCHLGVMFLKNENVVVLGGTLPDQSRNHANNLIAELHDTCVPEDRVKVERLKERIERSNALQQLLTRADEREAQGQTDADSAASRNRTRPVGNARTESEPVVNDVDFDPEDEVMILESCQTADERSSALILTDEEVVELLNDEGCCTEVDSHAAEEERLSYFWNISSAGPQRGKTWKVRAFILSITKRLYVLNNRWALHCLLNDGVSVEECLMLNEALDGIIGISADECRKLPAAERRRMDSPEARKRWQTTLANLCEIMEIVWTDPDLDGVPKFTVARIIS